jgi:2-phosphoglycerate kinase
MPRKIEGENTMPDNERAWEVLLIGGASGTGKTRVSYRLARHFGIGITEVDDLTVAIKRMTTPEQQPIIHYWDTHAESIEWTAEQIVELTISVLGVMAPAIEAVIENHLESSVPLVLDGDYMLPATAMQTEFGGYANNGRVRGVFLYEPDEAQIVANFLQREPEEGEQTGRARVSWLLGQWFKQEAERVGGIALPARPWETLFERVVAALG